MDDVDYQNLHRASLPLSLQISARVDASVMYSSTFWTISGRGCIGTPERLRGCEARGSRIPIFAVRERVVDITLPESS